MDSCINTLNHVNRPKFSPQISMPWTGFRKSKTVRDGLAIINLKETSEFSHLNQSYNFAKYCCEFYVQGPDIV